MYDQNAMDDLCELLCSRSKKIREATEAAILDGLPARSRDEYIAIREGRLLPPLTSDIIAKKIFDPDEHPERLETFLRKIAKDDKIEIAGSFGNEGVIKSIGSKKVIFDIPARLMDGRLSDTEFQVAQQDYIFRRGEIYSSEMLMIQYSVGHGEKKSGLDYNNAKGTILIILMLKSPEKLEQFESDRYIHRFTEHVSDTGFRIKSLQDIIYVQLDKCLGQFVGDIDGEGDKDVQLLLSMIADINNEKVRSGVKRLQNEMLADIYDEVKELSQEKEVQAMLLAEKYAQADLNAAFSFQWNKGKAEGRAEGIISGGSDMLFQLVADGDLPLEKAAKKMGVSKQEFTKRMRVCGYRLPD